MILPRLLCWAMSLGPASSLHAAGGGPETTVVVVHGGSPISRTLALRYAQLRDIPASHVLVLDRVPGSGPTSARIPELQTVIDGILRPLVLELQDRGLEEVVDTVVYSAGFPYAVSFAAEARQDGLPKLITPTASLTGLTYFARELVRGDRSGLALEANAYFVPPRLGLPGPGLIQGRGYSVTRAWSTGEGVEDPAVLDGASSQGEGGYLLSTFLCYLGVRGNLPAEAAAQIERNAVVDGSFPQGSVYLMANEDVRARTRMPLFELTLAQLQARGRPAALLSAGQAGEDGVLPRKRQDVLGAVIGRASFDWSRSGSRLVPGALAESLTSFGAHFHTDSQTKLTALLAAGAAGSSGTVVEPFALQAKFPTPLLHAFYADGCSMAEAFYQSVQGPYQLLVVGDALARPFAHLVEVQGRIHDAERGPRDLRSAGRLSGEVILNPGLVPGSQGGAAVTEAGAEASTTPSFEVWLDGRRQARLAADQDWRFDTRQIDDGVHALRLVAIASDAVATRSGRSFEVEVRNGPRELATPEPIELTVGEPVDLQLNAPGWTRVELQLDDGRVHPLRKEGRRFRLQLFLGSRGVGEETHWLIAQDQDGGRARAPLRLRWTPPKPAAAEGPRTPAGVRCISSRGAVCWLREWTASSSAALRARDEGEWTLEASLSLQAGEQELGFLHDGTLQLGLAGQDQPPSIHGQDAIYAGHHLNVLAGHHAVQARWTPAESGILEPFLVAAEGSRDSPALRWTAPAELGSTIPDLLVEEPAGAEALCDGLDADASLPSANSLTLRLPSAERLVGLMLSRRSAGSGWWPGESDLEVEVSSDGRRFRRATALELQPGWAPPKGRSVSVLTWRPQRIRSVRLQLPGGLQGLCELRLLTER